MASNMHWMMYSGFVAHGIFKHRRQPPLQRPLIALLRIAQDVHTINPVNTRTATGTHVQSVMLEVIHFNFHKLHIFKTQRYLRIEQDQTVLFIFITILREQ